MGVSQPPLEILSIVLKVMREIKRMGKENGDNTLISSGALKSSSLGVQKSAPFLVLGSCLDAMRWCCSTR